MSRQNSTPSRTLSGVIQPVRIGFVPLADCAPLLVAQELGLFQKHGVMVRLSCEVGWATVREKLLHRQLDAAHAIAGLALAMRTGISAPPMPVVAPFVFNLHGNAITLARDLWNRGVRDAESLRKLLRSSPGRVLTLGVVSRFSSHAFLLRRWLETGGIVDHDPIRVVVLPPTQMAANLAAGLIDGYCVGEPWNSVAVAEGHGWIAATSEQLAPEHPEKVLLFSENFVSDHHDQASAIIAALKEACAWCDGKSEPPRGRAHSGRQRLVPKLSCIPACLARRAARSGHGAACRRLFFPHLPSSRCELTDICARPVARAGVHEPATGKREPTCRHLRRLGRSLETSFPVEHRQRKNPTTCQ